MQFWIGIGLGTLISLAASIVANIYQEHINNFLENRKLLSRGKRRNKAIQFHKLIVDLHTSKRDKYLFFIGLALNTIMPFILGVASLTAATTILAVKATSIAEEFALLPRYAATPYFLLFITLLGMILAVLGIRRIRQIQNALDQFEEFKTQFKAKWHTPED